MGVDLTQLRYFLEVKARGSLTAAAKTLGVSQPTLTVAIQSLEKSLQTTLLLRGRTGVTLTATGRSLAHDADEIFAVLSRAEARITGIEDREVGRFVIGCHEPLGAYFLPAFLRELYEKYPGLEPTLFNGPSALVRDAVIARDVDFGLVVNPSPHPDLVLVRLFLDAIDFFVKAEEPRSRRGDLTPSRRSARITPKEARTRDEARERVRRGPLIHAGRVSESRELLHALERQGVIPERMLSCGDFELVKALTRSGVGVGVLPRRVASYGHDGDIVRLHPDLPHFQDKIFLVYRADLHKTRAALRLKQSIIDHGKALAAH